VLIAEARQVNHELAQSYGPIRDMVGELVLHILVVESIFALKLSNLLIEYLQVCISHEVLQVELKLR
jgi:hypothetical protein